MAIININSRINIIISVYITMLGLYSFKQIKIDFSIYVTFKKIK